MGTKIEFKMSVSVNQRGGKLDVFCSKGQGEQEKVFVIQTISLYPGKNTRILKYAKFKEYKNFAEKNALTGKVLTCFMTSLYKYIGEWRNNIHNNFIYTFEYEDKEVQTEVK